MGANSNIQGTAKLFYLSKTGRSHINILPVSSATTATVSAITGSTTIRFRTRLATGTLTKSPTCGKSKVSVFSS